VGTSSLETWLGRASFNSAQSVMFVYRGTAPRLCLIRTLSGEAAGRNLLSRSELHPKALEEQMTQQDDKKPLAPKAQDQSHKPAKHIEETARLASSETAKDPSKVRRTKD
jgi:hypothetical protein